MAPSLFLTAFLASTTCLFASTVSAQTATTPPKAIETLDCYKSAYPLVQQGEYTFQTSGYCQTQCAAINKPVMAITEGSTCYCGDKLPPTANKVSDGNCNTPCNGFDQQNCGGNGFWQVYLTGLTNDVDTASNSGNPSSSSGSDDSSSTSASPSVITKAGQTIVVTASASSDSNSNKSSGTSKVGIAVGVVVGLMAIAGIVGGIILFLKRRRRLAIEEEHRRNAAVSQFVKGGKPGSSASSDQRLDPSINSHRRQSIGSIADERDFSRRILQVRNPDRDSKASNLA